MCLNERVRRIERKIERYSYTMTSLFQLIFPALLNQHFEKVWRLLSYAFILGRVMRFICIDSGVITCYLLHCDFVETPIIVS